MSTKQITRVAAEGRKITVVVDPGSIGVDGYVVGMDDYHWLLACPVGSDAIDVLLVHKGLAPTVLLHSEPTLDAEPTPIREQVLRVGGGFFAHCRSLLSRPPTLEGPLS